MFIVKTDSILRKRKILYTVLNVSHNKQIVASEAIKQNKKKYHEFYYVFV